MSSRQIEITCSICGADTLLTRIPQYDGFTKVGETLKCASCGHEYASEDEVPFRKKQPPRCFSESDRLRKPPIFDEHETAGNCRHCKHYVVNPFTQRCGLTQEPVEATDDCDDFESVGAKPADKK